MKFECSYFDNGLRLITPAVFGDDRGYFMETFSARDLKDALPEGIVFVQDNESCSQKGIFRGFHYQLGEAVQAKLVRVIKGAVEDIVIDIRQSSPTFGKAYSFLLTGENKAQLFVPRGFAHGFVSLEDNTVFSYKCDNYYNGSKDAGISAFDSKVIDAVNMTEFEFDPSSYVTSEKDRKHPNLADASHLNLLF